MKRWIFAVAVVLVLAGCDSPSRTIDTARKQLAEFQAAPDAEKQAAVEKSLDKLDAQIEQLAQKGDRSQADLLRSQASGLHTDFQAAKMARAFNDVKNAIQGIGDAFKDAGKSFSETLKKDGTNPP
jgi:ABC-type Fe3+ transport system substrate-binding protein